MSGGEKLLALVVIAYAITPIVALVVALRARARSVRVEKLILALGDANDRLAQEVARLRAEVGRLAEGRQLGPEAPAAEATRAPPAPAALPREMPAAPPTPRAPSPAPLPRGPGARPQPQAKVAVPPPPPAGETATPEAQVPPPPVRPPRPPTPPPPPRAPIDLERIGAKVASWAAGILVAAAGILFLKYSVDHGWLRPPIRVAMGLVAGVGLLVACETRRAQKYAVTANALTAAGIAVLFSTIFAARALWGLVGVIPAFLLMALVAAVAVALAIRRDSLFIAVLGLLGGFATPALLSTGVDHPIGLFGYLLLINAGIAFVAYRKGWRILTVLCLVLTTIYQWGWIAKFLNEDKLPIAAAAFLAFPILSIGAFVAAGRRSGEVDPVFARVVAWGALLPLALPLYLASVREYGAHFGLLFGFLALVVVGLAVIAATRGPKLLHLAGAATTLLVFGAWLALSYGVFAWPQVLFITGGFVAIFLLAPVVADKLRHPLDEQARLGVLAAPLLLFVLVTLACMEPATAAPLVFLGTTLLVVAACVAFGAFHDTTSVPNVAFAMGFLAMLAWSLVRMDSHSLLLALAAFALLGLMATASAARAGSLPLFALATHALVLVALVQPTLASSPWPPFAVVAVVTCALAVAGLHDKDGRVFAAGVSVAQLLVLAWFVLGTAMSRSSDALSLVGAFAVLGAAALLLARRVGAEGEPIPGVRKVGGFVAAAVFAPTLGFAVAGAVEVHAATHLGLVAGVHALLVLLLLVTARRAAPGDVALFAVLPFGAVTFAWTLGPSATPWPDLFLVALAPYVLFLLHAATTEARARRDVMPWAAAVAASAPFLWFARQAFVEGGHAGIVGIVPVAQALVMTGLLVQLLRAEPAGERWHGRLALVAGAALGLVAVAIPLQLEKQWITVGWALMAAALAWLNRRIPHRGLVLMAALLGCAVFIRLACNPWIFDYRPRADVAIWNWYLYAFVVSAAALFAAARLLKDHGDRLIPPIPPLSSLFNGFATILLFVLLNIEIADYYSTGPRVAFRWSAGLSADLTYTLGWAIFASALMVAGIVTRNRVARIAAIALLAVTVLKAFLHDLRSLTDLWRIASFVGLAICLVFVAWLLQAFVLRDHEVKS